MIPCPLKAANLKIATLTILLREARNGLNAAFLLLAESDRADEAFKKFGHLGKEINKYAPDKAAFPAKERRA